MKDILKFIKAVRESFPDSVIVYTQGACYGFHKILKSVYPNAIPYANHDDTHIITKIGEEFYDISGEYLNYTGSPVKGIKKLTNKQRDYWETVVSGQRIEYMLKKYNGENNN